MEEHHINIEKIVQSINKDVDESRPFQSGYCICRVSKGLRKAKPKAYEPMVVSIGPYHFQNPKLQAMRKCKVWCLHSLLRRRKESLESYILELKKWEGKVRGFYAESIDLNSEKFVEMMLLDACFIIEFFRGNDPTINVGWMRNQILEDMMLHENQLPFCLLSKLYGMTKDPTEKEPLMKKAMESMKQLRTGLKFKNMDEYDSKNIKHLLHLVHVLCRPSPKRKISAERSNKNIIMQLVYKYVTSTCKHIHLLYKYVLRRPETSNLDEFQSSLLESVESETSNLDDIQSSLLEPVESETSNIDEIQSPIVLKNNLDEIQSPMRSAIVLKEAGVKFEKVVSSTETANIFDIGFEAGSMKIPCFSVQHFTDTFFRNLIAFEQLSDVNPKYFTDYMHFMDQLISSEKDVELLRDAGIIINLLGDDQQVSKLFNKLGDGVIISLSKDYYYSEERKKVNTHCDKRWNKMKAKLRHDYFNTPWATISTIAAIVLLGLTIAQTIASFI